MSAAFLEKLWNIGIIPTKWSLENCDKVWYPVKPTNSPTIQLTIPIIGDSQQFLPPKITRADGEVQDG